MKGHSMHPFILHSSTRSKKKCAQQKPPLRYAELTASFSALTPHPPAPDPQFMDRTNALGVPLICPVFCWAFSTCPLQVLGLPFSDALCAPGDPCSQTEPPGIPGTGGSFLVRSISHRRVNQGLPDSTSTVCRLWHTSSGTTS